MRINFEDKSFIEIKLSKNPGHVEVILGALDFQNPLKRIINTAEITIKDFSKLVYSLGITLTNPINSEKVEAKEQKPNG